MCFDDGSYDPGNRHTRSALKWYIFSRSSGEMGAESMNATAEAVGWYG